MTPTATITFVTGVIACIVGIATFVVGMISRAKDSGVLAHKVDTALQGIEEIKKTLSEQRTWREAMAIEVEAHEQKIKSLFERQGPLETDVRYLKEYLHPFQNRKVRKD